MKLKSKSSKRIPCSRRYRLQKLQKERLRKRKRDERKNPRRSGNVWKDTKIPNSTPFKDTIISEAKRALERSAEEKRLRRLVNGVQIDPAQELNCEDRAQGRPGRDATELFSKELFSEVNRVIEMSDVVVQVLDARDPLGTRSHSVESQINTRGKKMVLLLNKCDLIPPDNLRGWLSYLGKSFPTIPFRASTQNQKKNLSQNRHLNMKKTSDDVFSEGKNCLGAQHLLKLLGNYCRNGDIMTSIKVGIVGYPNVGKSSLINSLKRNKACSTGAVPGLTRKAREVNLNKLIQLIDSPGVVEDRSDSTSATLRNASRVEKLSDPLTPALEIVKRSGREQLSLQYKIQDNFENGDEFLVHLARTRGYINKGGILNTEKAARLLLNDWNTGKIKYHTVPPEGDGLSEFPSTTILSSYTEEFNLTEETPPEMMELCSNTPQKSAIPDDCCDSLNPPSCVKRQHKGKALKRMQGKRKNNK